MSTFKIGQRVRIRHCFNAHLFGNWAGREGTIIAEHDGGGYGHGWEVCIDGEGLFRKPSNHPHWFSSDQLEPLQDLKQRERVKNETVPWAECCFDREGKYREKVAA